MDFFDVSSAENANSVLGNNWNDPFSTTTYGLVDNWTGTSASHEQAKQNLFSLYNTALNMDYQQFMRGTNYQATVDDLKKAGLNPILAYQQGPNSTPGTIGGSATSAASSNGSAPAAIIGAALSGAAKIISSAISAMA